MHALSQEDPGSLEEGEIPVEIGKKEVGGHLDRLIAFVGVFE